MKGSNLCINRERLVVDAFVQKKSQKEFRDPGKNKIDIIFHG
jgi:hypothetical protein